MLEVMINGIWTAFFFYMYLNAGRKMKEYADSDANEIWSFFRVLMLAFLIRVVLGLLLSIF